MKYIKLLLAAVALISSTTAASDKGECGGSFGKCPTGYCCSKFGYCGKSEDHCGVGCQSKFGKCNATNKVTTTTKKTVKTTTTTKKAAKATTTIKPATKKTTTTKKVTTTKKTTTTKKVTTTKKTTTTKKITTTTTINQSLPVSTNGMCGPKYGICPGNSCCSQYGYCGRTSDHCDTGCNPAYGTCYGTDDTTTTTTGKKIVTTTTKKITTTTKKTTTTTKSTKPTSEKIISTNGLCGPENGNTSCPEGYCCSQYGYCGRAKEYCDTGCRPEFGTCGYDPEEEVTGFQYYDECVNKKHWALTFDDGPYKYDLALLSLLRKLNVKATFFINGDNVMDIKTAQAKEIIQTMHKDGHVIASHTWSHSNIEKISKSELISEMTKLEDYIYKYTGKKPAFMRPPYGAGNGNNEVAKTLKSLGYTAACMWNVDTLDWDKTGNVDYALSEFKKYVNKKVGILSLNHNYYGTISESSLLTLIEAEVKYMRSQGYTPVTMDECLGLKAYQ